MWRRMISSSGTIFRSRVSAGMLLIFDLGYTNFACFAQMTGAGITSVTRAKDNLVYEVAKG